MRQQKSLENVKEIRSEGAVNAKLQFEAPKSRGAKCKYGNNGRMTAYTELLPGGRPSVCLSVGRLCSFVLLLLTSNATFFRFSLVFSVIF